MARFNNKGIPTVGPKSVIVSTGETTRTHEGGTGYLRDAKSELFLLAASFMGGDDNFYEKSDGRYGRLVSLVSEEEVTTDPVWIYNFVKWLRTEANMRTVSMVVALEAVRIRVLNELTDEFIVYTPLAGSARLTNRSIVDVALNRADEPAEAIAYWLAKHGKPIPQPIKNGIADAAVRLYNEYSYLKYGKSRSATVGMIDVLRLTHPTAKNQKQNALFNLIVGKSKVEGYGADTLPMIHARQSLQYIAPDLRREVHPDTIKAAGMTWENLSEWLPGGMDAGAWELAIPNMGVMALIRNLRNFDQAGISGDSRRYVMDKIMDKDVVAKSRQLPFRWYNAYRAVESLHYAMALEEALDISLANVPTFKGKTLVLVDMSGSMFHSKVSDRSNVTYADVASLFGAALKLRNPDGVDLFQYGSEFRTLVGRYQTQAGIRFSDYTADKQWDGVAKEIKLSNGGSVLRAMNKFQDMGGTETHKAFEQVVLRRPVSYNRIILLSDEQSYGSSIWSRSSLNYDDLPVPAGSTLYIWNLAGYKAGTSASGRYHRHTFGGLSDSAFKLIPILEAGKNGGWPWEVGEVPASAR